MKTATSRAVVVVTARPPGDEDDATARDSAPLLDEAADLLPEQGVPATTQALEGDPAEALIESGMLRGSFAETSSPTHRATCSWCARPMEGALSRQPEREPHRLRLECSVCGYGAARAVPPERCPMCQREGTWKEARLVVRPHGRDG
jgi:hypothetical protein